MVADSNYIHTPQRISYPSNNEVYPLNLKIMIEHLILLVKRAGLEPRDPRKFLRQTDIDQILHI